MRARAHASTHPFSVSRNRCNTEAIVQSDCSSEGEGRGNTDQAKTSSRTSKKGKATPTGKWGRQQQQQQQQQPPKAQRYLHTLPKIWGAMYEYLHAVVHGNGVLAHWLIHNTSCGGGSRSLGAGSGVGGCVYRRKEEGRKAEATEVAGRQRVV